MFAKPYSTGFTGIFTIGRSFMFLFINPHVLPLESGKLLRYQTYRFSLYTASGAWAYRFSVMLILE